MNSYRLDSECGTEESNEEQTTKEREIRRVARSRDPVLSRDACKTEANVDSSRWDAGRRCRPAAPPGGAVHASVVGPLQRPLQAAAAGSNYSRCKGHRRSRLLTLARPLLFKLLKEAMSAHTGAFTYGFLRYVITRSGHLIYNLPMNQLII